MNYTIFNVKEKEYKLKLSTRRVIELEKVLGCNPIMIFGLAGDRIPTITEMIHVLHNSLVELNHGISKEDTYQIFDEWLEDHVTTDFIPVIIEIYKASGIIRDNEKN